LGGSLFAAGERDGQATADPWPAPQTHTNFIPLLVILQYQFDKIKDSQPI
jgi:hypothetical protein